ncbi:MAG: cation transporter [Paracoccaceae bacterium]
MRHVITGAGLAAILLSAGPALAAEQTVTLAVDNLFCASCPYIVKRTLANVPGVMAVEVSYDEKTAVVTFEDSQTDVATLTEATGNIGFPSRLMPEGG